MQIKIEKRHLVQIGIVDNLLSPLVSVVATLILSALILWIIDFPILKTFHAFFIEPFSSLYNFIEIIMRASILILIALGLCIGFRANIWNIGAEGQFIMGAVVGSWVAITLNDQEGLHVIALMLFGGVVGGMFWGAIPAYLKNKFQANEILTSLMLVYVAEYFLKYLVHGPLKDPQGLNFPQSIYFSPSATFPYLIEDTRFSLTAIFVLGATPIVYILLNYSYFGYQLAVKGMSEKTSRFCGFSASLLTWSAFLIAGALAGLAGISEVATNIGQLVPVVSPGYGFTAIIVAFLGRLNPLGIVLSGLLMALIYIGAESAQIALGLPVAVGGIFQGLILFCLLASDFFIFYRISIKSPKTISKDI